jgi:hypothetical protein
VGLCRCFPFGRRGELQLERFGGDQFFPALLRPFKQGVGKSDGGCLTHTRTGGEGRQPTTLGSHCQNTLFFLFLARLKKSGARQSTMKFNLSGAAKLHCPPPPARVLALRVVLARSVTFMSPVIYGDLLTCRVKVFCAQSPQESSSGTDEED